MGWAGPVGPDGAGMERRKKTRLLNGQVQVSGTDLRVGFGHKETWPELNPLSFLKPKLPWLLLSWLEGLALLELQLLLPCRLE